MAQENREAQMNKELHEQQQQSHMKYIIEQIAAMNERFGKMELEIKEVKAQNSSNKEASTSNAKRDSTLWRRDLITNTLTDLKNKVSLILS